MRRIVRDFGVFLYGCIFAYKYFFLGRGACQPEKQDRTCGLRLRPVLVIPRR
jgi:hypothetical protein